MFSLAKLIMPESNETKEVDVAQTWEVRWHAVSLDLAYSSFTRFEPALEVFTDEADAKDFAQALRNAWSVARVTGLRVEVKKRPLIR